MLNTEITQSLIASTDEEDDEINNPESIALLKSRNEVLNRLELLYIKIWLGLRWAVSQSFRQQEGDVLAAGSNVQVFLIYLHIYI
jgi:hypothetical protein